MPDTGAPYFIPYLDGTELIRGYPDLSEDLANAIVSALEAIPVREKRIAAFTGSGTWTVPAGVTYAIAHMMGGGGGCGNGNNAGVGAQSSVAFSSGTVVANGGNKGVDQTASSQSLLSAGQANTGQGAQGASGSGGAGTNSGASVGGQAMWITAGSSVTPGASISVVVGAGGTAGSNGAAGGSGYVYIEYYEEV